jgi:hypothetical protein
MNVLQGGGVISVKLDRRNGTIKGDVLFGELVSITVIDDGVGKVNEQTFV